MQEYLLKYCSLTYEVAGLLLTLHSYLHKSRPRAVKGWHYTIYASLMSVISCYSPQNFYSVTVFFFCTRNAENTQSLCVHPPPNIADKLKTHRKNTSMVSNLTDSPEGPDSTPLTSSAAACSAVC